MTSHIDKEDAAMPNKNDGLIQLTYKKKKNQSTRVTRVQTKKL